MQQYLRQVVEGMVVVYVVEDEVVNEENDDNVDIYNVISIL